MSGDKSRLWEQNEAGESKHASIISLSLQHCSTFLSVLEHVRLMVFFMFAEAMMEQVVYHQ